MGTGGLAALGRDGDQARHLALEQLTDPCANGRIFNNDNVAVEALTF